MEVTSVDLLFEIGRMNLKSGYIGNSSVRRAMPEWAQS